MSRRIFTATPKNYGGAYDIDPEMFFTRDDLDDLNQAVLEHISETFSGNYKIEDSYIGGPDNQTVHVEVEDVDNGVVHYADAHIDMRKIKRPSDLRDKYALDLAGGIIEAMKEYSEVVESATSIQGSTEDADSVVQYRIYEVEYIEDEDDYEELECIDSVDNLDTAIALAKQHKQSSGNEVHVVEYNEEEEYTERVWSSYESDVEASTDIYSTECQDELAEQYIRNLDASGIDLSSEDDVIDELINNFGFSPEDAQSLFLRMTQCQSSVYGGLFGKKKQQATDPKARMQAYMDKANQVGDQLDALQQEALTRYGRPVHSADCVEDSCYQNVATGRTYSTNQMKDMYNYHQSRNGYTGSYEEWVQERLDEGTIVTCASDEVTASYDAPGPGDYNPPEDPRDEVADVEEICEIEMRDVIINILEDGSWEYEDTDYPWARESETSPDLYSQEYTQVMLSDLVGTVENVDAVIESLLPAEPGRYAISGDVKLVYEIEGIMSQTFPSMDEDNTAGDVEYYTDDVDVSFNYKKSSASNFKYKKVRKTRSSIDSSTAITASFNEIADGHGYWFRELEGGDIQVSMHRPYDDADYFWARYKASDEQWLFCKAGKVHQRRDSLNANPIDDTQWVADALNSLNSNIKSKMMHN